MAIDGVGARTSYLGSSILNLRSQLDTLQEQLASGKISHNYAGQGVDRSFGVGLRAQLSGLSAFADTATNVNTRLSAANLSLQGLVDLGGTVKASANNSDFTINSAGQTVGQGAAVGAFTQALALLNVQSGDRYLFSGRATDTPATASADAILNGSGAQAGLKQLIAERKQADLGASGLGRLAIGAPTATSVSVAEDGSQFGLKLNAVRSSLTGATVTGPAGAPPQATVDLGATNPSDGDKITFTFNLPDGTTEPVTLTASSATPPPPGGFTIGATPAATAANLQGALTASIGTLASTALTAASAMTASDNFFSSPPLRVNGPPFDTAMTLVNGTAANTVTWYTGESGADPARGTAVAQIDQAITVQYGARANEPAITAQLKAIAAYAATTISATDPNASGQITALSGRVTSALTPPTGAQTIQDIQSDLAGVQTAVKAATDRQTQTKAMAQNMLDSIENADPNETATKILALQTSLSASYQTTAMLYQISLMKYLPVG